MIRNSRVVTASGIQIVTLTNIVTTLTINAGVTAILIPIVTMTNIVTMTINADRTIGGTTSKLSNDVLKDLSNTLTSLFHLQCYLVLDSLLYHLHNKHYCLHLSLLLLLQLLHCC